jgi:hypothetical protein
MTDLAIPKNENGSYIDKWGRKVYKCGYVPRRTDILKKWKPVYLVVREDKFCWFKSKEAFENGKKKSGGMTYIEGFVDREHENEFGGRKFIFSYNSRNRVCFIQASSEEDRNEWIQMVKQAIKDFSEKKTEKKSKYSHLS